MEMNIAITQIIHVTFQHVCTVMIPPYRRVGILELKGFGFPLWDLRLGGACSPVARGHGSLSALHGSGAPGWGIGLRCNQCRTTMSQRGMEIQPASKALSLPVNGTRLD